MGLWGGLEEEAGKSCHSAWGPVWVTGFCDPRRRLEGKREKERNWEKTEMYKWVLVAQGILEYDDPTECVSLGNISSHVSTAILSSHVMVAISACPVSDVTS